MPSPAQRQSLLKRALAIFTDVRPEEIPLVLTFTLNVFLLLTAYYLIKPVREALILSLEAGAEYKSYMSAAIAIALLLAVPAYAKLVDRVSRVRLVVGVTLFFASHLVGFYLASKVPEVQSRIGLVFYVWVGIFNMMVVAQLWAFASDLYDAERGTRLFPLVALGASLGAALGSKVAALIIGPLGVYTMLLVGAALLCMCAALFALSERLARPGAGFTPSEAVVKAPTPQSAARARPTTNGAFALVFRHRYLLAIAGFTLIFSFANSNGEYMLGKLIKGAALERVASGELASGDVGAYIGREYADFFFVVNALGVLLQAFVVSRIVKHGGLRLAILVFPVLTLASGLAAFTLPILGMLRVGKTLENAADYSLNNTVRQLLWLPTTAEMKYKAKQAIDTFFVRAGDVSSALLVYVGSVLLDWSVRGFALTNAALAASLVLLSFAILREHKKLSPEVRDDAPGASGSAAPTRAAGVAALKPA
jgi:ATP:ADP antiporter, AAA family